ncbi:TIGR04219 family outer membrane beta-barrel protein [Alcanivorax sp. JB21]|uniref:TIGR04219 family outer membrane beta-barrel protein n=1 Tax=Alcanivorax limicola TaxID=2874102 RepID=UPI001CC09026|nr:TIGR04219 family outer membrane beta-barrel protein [Alcanivorax limicola]MBZ2189870.1 TIGR04219 family outer membrane beta-barrel protein [Alcanivorax limicola]
MRKTLMAAGLVALAPAAQSAPLIDVYAGAYTWNASLSGTIASGNDDIDMKDDLGYGRERQNVLYFGLEHVVPMVPNVRLKHMVMSDSSRNTIERSFQFGGGTFVITDEVQSEFDLDMTDLTLYYTPLDNVVKLDVGLNVRRVDADFRMRSGGDDGRETAKETFPMLHLAARGNLPFSGLYAGAEINAIRYDGSRVEDYTVKAGWVSDFLLGVELGYSQFNVELDDVSGLDTDLEFGGPYLALSLTF